jgi:hypothetical protein
LIECKGLGQIMTYFVKWRESIWFFENKMNNRNP